MNPGETQLIRATSVYSTARLLAKYTIAAFEKLYTACIWGILTSMALTEAVIIKFPALLFEDLPGALSSLYDIVWVDAVIIFSTLFHVLEVWFAKTPALATMISRWPNLIATSFSTRAASARLRTSY
ncbi:hypothetical protein F5Y03DRAFT_34086 [Xylaria venustula]|nr:hypothetical protein F5Y03DRAFT_34086 [Xylaria venustula]